MGSLIQLLYIDLGGRYYDHEQYHVVSQITLRARLTYVSWEAVIVPPCDVILGT